MALSKPEQKGIFSQIFERFSNSINRPEKKCCIVMYGISGTGKSSTINHLFSTTVRKSNSNDGTMAKTSDTSSETRATSEYKIVSKDNEFCVTLIDTPGYGDTLGQRQDARNISTISKMFQSKDYKNKMPNLIFITLKATENRYMGDSSQFVQSLKCLNMLEIVDKNSPNVVMILSNCCSLSPHYLRNKEIWLTKIEKLKNDMKSLVYDYVGVKAPVLILENNFEEEGLDRKCIDGKVSEFTTLPNDETQPLNLYKACLEVLQKNKDYCGEAHFNKCFVHYQCIEHVSRGMEIKANTSENQGVDSVEDTLYEIIRNDASGLSMDENYEKAKKFMIKEGLTNSEKDEITEIEDQLRRMGKPYAPINWFKFILKNEPSEKSMQFMKNEINLREEIVPVHLIDSLEFGFRLNKDEFSQSKIWEMKMAVSEWGLELPSYYTVEKVTFRKQWMSFEIPVGQKYFERVLKDSVVLNGPFPEIREKSVITEVRLFRLSLNEDTSFVLKKEFEEDVKQLPLYYDSSKSEIYHQFFKKFGTSFISNAFVGGYRRVTKTKMECAGGDVKLVEGNDESVMENLEKWKISIISSPTLLLNELHLEPISKAVELVDSKKSESVIKALNHLIDCNLKNSTGKPVYETWTSNEESKSEPITRQGASDQYSTLGTVALGTTVGAGIGAFGGPVGAVIGGAIGGAFGLVKSIFS